MEWLVSLVGIGLVMAALRDLFHTLWHPTRHGGLSHLVMTALWRLARQHLRARRRVVGLVGPLAMVTVVGMWAGVIILGWAIVYWPHMPGAFTFTPGSRAANQPTLLDSLYLSLVTPTLGLGWSRLPGPRLETRRERLMAHGEQPAQDAPGCGIGRRLRCAGKAVMNHLSRMAAKSVEPRSDHGAFARCPGDLRDVRGACAHAAPLWA